MGKRLRDVGKMMPVVRNGQFIMTEGKMELVDI